MKTKATDKNNELQFCRKCMRKLGKKSERRFHTAKNLIKKLADEKHPPRACGCFDVCPKKGVVVKYHGKKITMKL